MLELCQINSSLAGQAPPFFLWSLHTSGCHHLGPSAEWGVTCALCHYTPISGKLTVARGFVVWVLPAHIKPIVLYRNELWLSSHCTVMSLKLYKISFLAQRNGTVHFRAHSFTLSKPPCPVLGPPFSCTAQVSNNRSLNLLYSIDTLLLFISIICILVALTMCQVLYTWWVEVILQSFIQGQWYLFSKHIFSGQQLIEIDRCVVIFSSFW